MQKIKKQDLILAVIFILISCFLFYSYINELTIIYEENTENSPPPNLPLNKVEEKGEGRVFLEINGTKHENEITGINNVYDLMNKLRQEEKITFKDKNYPGMGKFIEEINGIKNSGEKNWIYYVNDKKAEIGISNYKLKNGDKISWRYE